MGRARGPKRSAEPVSGRGLPPELVDLQRRGGMSADWHAMWHARGGGVQEMANDRHLLWSRLRKADAEEARVIWRETVASWPHELYNNDHLLDSWVQHIEKSEDDQRQLPGLFLVTPGADKAPYLQQLLGWKNRNPDDFSQFLQKEIIPGIRGRPPSSLEMYLTPSQTLFWKEVLEQEVPESLGALAIIENLKGISFPARIRYMYAWNIFAEINKGQNQEEAVVQATASTMRDLLFRWSLDEELRDFLRKEFPRCRGLLPSGLDGVSEQDLWKFLQPMFDNPSAWSKFARGELHFEQLLCNFLKKNKI